jgi:hypothetical protein
MGNPMRAFDRDEDLGVGIKMDTDEHEEECYAFEIPVSPDVAPELSGAMTNMFMQMGFTVEVAFDVRGPLMFLEIELVREAGCGDGGGGMRVPFKPDV